MILSRFVHCIPSLRHLKLSLSSEIKVHRIYARQKSVSLSVQRVQGVQTRCACSWSPGHLVCLCCDIPVETSPFLLLTCNGGV